MNLLIGAVTVGLILALLGLGVFVSYRICDTLDLTADGSYGVGAAVVAALLVRELHPATANCTAVLAGALAGVVTGVLRTRLLVNAVLAGVLTSTALYSVILFVMGSGNLSIASTESLVTLAERLGQPLLPANVTSLILMTVMAAGVAVAIGLFLETDLGLAMRAAGSNPQMARALAIDVNLMVVLGLGLSNGLIALSGALFAQYAGFASIEMGIGSLVVGLANLMVGEGLLGKSSIRRWIAGAVVGSVVFRLLVAGAVRAGLNPNALKLVTAVFVLGALTLPAVIRQGRPTRWLKGAGGHA